MDMHRIHAGLYCAQSPYEKTENGAAVPMLRVEAYLDGEDRAAGSFCCPRNAPDARRAALAFFREELAQTAYALTNIGHGRVPWTNDRLYGCWSRFARISDRHLLRVVQDGNGRNTMELRGPRNRILTRQPLPSGTGEPDARLAEDVATAYLKNALKQYRNAIDITKFKIWTIGEDIL